MRIASVLHDASPEPDGAPFFPAVALERDGALYRASALASAYGPRCAALHEEPDFRSVVVTLGAEPLHELDERLKTGDRPSSARLLPGAFTWLPPCDTERAALLLCAPYATEGAPPASEPSFRVASARALLGHEATVPLLGGEGGVDVECSLAVVLGEELWRATAAEVEEAILGYTLLIAWTAGRTCLAAQLGPVLVTRDEAGPMSALRTQLRVDGAPIASCRLDAWTFSPAESAAWISHHVPLHPGDVIGAGCVRGGRAADAGVPIPFGARVDFAVERLGRLSGRPSPGPAMRAWRRTSAR